MGRHAAPDDAPAERVDRDEERVERVGAGGRRRSGSTSARSGGRGDRGRAPPRRRRRRRRRSRSPTIVEPRLSTLARTLASNRVAVRGPERLLDDDRRPASAGTARPGRAAGGRRRRSARRPSTTDAVDDVRRDLDARDEVARPRRSSRRSAVKTSSGSSRFSRSSSAIRTWRTPSCAARRSTRLWDGPAPRSGPGRRRRPPGGARRRPRGGRRARGRGRVTGPTAERGGPRRSASRSAGDSRRPFDQRCAADDEVARQDGPDQRRPAARRPGVRSARARTPMTCRSRRSAEPAERRLDRPPRVDHRHRGPVLAVGVDVAVDGHAVGGVGGRGGDRGA